MRADSFVCTIKTHMSTQWHVKDPGHSAVSVRGRFWKCIHKVSAAQLLPRLCFPQTKEARISARERWQKEPIRILVLFLTKGNTLRKDYTVKFQVIFPGIVAVRYVSAFRRWGPVRTHWDKKAVFHGIIIIIMVIFKCLSLKARSALQKQHMKVEGDRVQK